MSDPMCDTNAKEMKHQPTVAAQRTPKHVLPTPALQVTHSASVPATNIKLHMITGGSRHAVN
jgi:hypothetical protein